MPIIVQEEIERVCDLRVNIFGSELFACKVEPKHPIAKVDSSFDVTAVWEPVMLPLAHKLHTLMELLKLASVKRSRHRFASSRWHPILTAGAQERHETPIGEPS
jgi:hypothetical protein